MDTSDAEMTPSYAKEEGELSDDGEIDDGEPNENKTLCFEYAHGIGKDLLAKGKGKTTEGLPQHAHYARLQRDTVANTKTRRENEYYRYRSNYSDRQTQRDRDSTRRRHDQHEPYRDRSQNLKGFRSQEMPWVDEKCSSHRTFPYAIHHNSYRYDCSPPRKTPNSSSSSHSWFRKRFRTSSGPSHITKDDEDFEALLREHKYIQDQLEKLETEELAANESDTSVSQRSKNRKDVSPGPEEKRGGPEDTVRSATNSPKPVNSHSVTLEQESDDEDELRKLVLASVAEKNKANVMIAEKVEENKKQEVLDVHQKRKPVKKPSTLTRRRHTSVDRKREEEERKNREKHHDERARRKQYEARRKREILAEKQHQQMMDLQRREIQRILTLDDPQEQAERFLNLLKRGRGTDREGIKQTPVVRSKKESVKKPEHVDNYEEVEMDLDSDEGDAAVIETGLDDSLLYEDSVPTNNTSSTLPFMDFYLPAALQASLYQNIFHNYNSYPYSNMHSLSHYGPTGIFDSTLFDTDKPTPPLVNEQKPPLPPEEHCEATPPPLPPPIDPVKIPLPPPLPDSPPPTLQIPLLKENPPLPKEKEVQDENDDEGEELMLREQLLLSMKKRQEEKLQEQSKGSDGSPNSSRDQSPAPSSVIISQPQVQKLKNKPMPLRGSDGSPNSSRGPSPAPRNVFTSKPQARKVKRKQMQIPIHERVVIRVNGDSSTSDSDSESSIQRGNMNHLESLDVFLKAARKNVEERDKESALNNDSNRNIEEKSENNAILTSRVKEYEAELQRQRKKIESDDTRFKVMLTKIAKYLRIQTSSEETIQMLKKQLDAQEKILSDTKDIVQRTRIEARKLKQTLLQNKESFREMEEKVIEFGKQVFGDGYQPKCGIQISKPLNNKRKVEIVKGAREVGIKRKKINKEEDKENQKVIRKQSLDQIALEKERLLKREKELAEKMKLLRGFNLLEDKKNVIKKKKVPTATLR